MTFIEKKTWYFDKPGPANTADAAKFAVRTGKGIKDPNHHRCKFFRKDRRGFP